MKIECDSGKGQEEEEMYETQCRSLKSSSEKFRSISEQEFSCLFTGYDRLCIVSVVTAVCRDCFAFAIIKENKTSNCEYWNDSYTSKSIGSV